METETETVSSNETRHALECFARKLNMETEHFCVICNDHNCALIYNGNWIASYEFATDDTGKTVTINLAGNHSAVTRTALNEILRMLGKHCEIQSRNDSHWICSTLDGSCEEISAWQWIQVCR